MFRKFFQKRRLRKTLRDPRFLFRSIPTLMKSARTGDRNEVVRLLNCIGARPSHRNNNLWGLIERVGHKPRRRYRG